MGMDWKGGLPSLRSRELRVHASCSLSSFQWTEINIFLLFQIFLMYQIQLWTWKFSSERDFLWIKEEGRKVTLALLGAPPNGLWLQMVKTQTTTQLLLRCVAQTSHSSSLHISLLRRAEAHQALLWGRFSSVCLLHCQPQDLAWAFSLVMILLSHTYCHLTLKTFILWVASV